MRVVIDTNVLVAALRSRHGASNAILVEVFRGAAAWLCSVPLFLEYEDVLMRAEFVLETGRSRDDYGYFLSDIASAVEPVELHFLWRPQLPDPKDEMVLETAVNGRATAIITHNVRDFSNAATDFGIEIIRPGEFLRRTRS